MNETVITIRTPRPYDYVLGTQILPSCGQRLHALFPHAATVGLVSDTNVAPLYAEGVTQALEGAGFRVLPFVVGFGERAKTLGVYANALRYFSESNLLRSDIIVGLGGGVVGDLTGFIAATYMRGISYATLPTTLLAMVDSSVGGKTGLNLPAGKNLCGAFWQPSLVLADTDTLLTLPPDEVHCGMGEVFKYGVLSRAVYDTLDKPDVHGLPSRASILACVHYKADLVTRDEHDTGARMLLNLGHTLGHAMEKRSRFRLPHGIAVAEALLLVACSAARTGKLSQKGYAAVTDLAGRLGFAPKLRYHLTDLIEDMRLDKKNVGKELTLVVPYDIGDCRTERYTSRNFMKFFGLL
ncbi:MAG: 3-dehydroquinate synthase [Clostridiales bacterium]|jgi:3-dehydroquinate synthase|nr:3-dehydroquinate synthase [Clostridiales bacterium]